MARASKRDHIIERATDLFLQQGFKGTSIDLVVTTCGVSKPTVYKHFPDKTILMTAVMTHWLRDPVPEPPEIGGLGALWQHLRLYWWAPEHMAMYRLVISEGWRFPAAAEAFWSDFDQAWWQAVETWRSTQPGIEAAGFELRLQAELWRRLTAPQARLV